VQPHIMAHEQIKCLDKDRRRHSTAKDDFREYVAD
jgi:hypothetical protein